MPLMGRQEMPLDMPVVLHRPEWARRDGVFRLVLFERARYVLAHQGFRGYCEAGLGDDVARLRVARGGRDSLSPLVLLLVLPFVTLACHRCPSWSAFRRLLGIGPYWPPVDPGSEYRQVSSVVPTPDTQGTALPE